MQRKVRTKMTKEIGIIEKEDIKEERYFVKIKSFSRWYWKDEVEEIEVKKLEPIIFLKTE